MNDRLTLTETQLGKVLYWLCTSNVNMIDVVSSSGIMHVKRDRVQTPPLRLNIGCEEVQKVGIVK